jgi:Ca2+-binding RTX toxin-like protein
MNDVIRGTAHADTLEGKSGDDKLFASGGNDVLIGRPGADILVCGPGHDVAIADRSDMVRADCEVVKGLPRPRSGHYAGTTSQGGRIAFDLASELTRLLGLGFSVDVACTEFPVVLTDQAVDVAGTPILVERDGSVYVHETGTVPEGSVDFLFAGSLRPSGSASGTLRIDLGVNTVDGVVHCTTGSVRWTAAWMPSGMPS